jgi:hypothetical protein
VGVDARILYFVINGHSLDEEQNETVFFIDILPARAFLSLIFDMLQ